MSLQLTGKLFEVFEEQQVSEKFRKREFVIEQPDGQYTQYIKMQLTQDKCSLIDNFQKGQTLKIDFNLNGKPFTKNGTTNYFTNVQAWRIEAQASTGESATGGTYEAQNGTPSFYSSDADNDLPF